MAKKLINFNFNGKFCEELSTLAASYPYETTITRYCTTAPSRITKFATETYVAELIANYLEQIHTIHLFVGKTARGEYVCEYKRSESKPIQVCIASLDSKGCFSFKAGLIDEEGLLEQYDSEEHSGYLFVAAMLPVIERNTEATVHMDVLKNYGIDEEFYSEAMCGITSNIYYRLKDELSTEPVKYDKEPKKLTQANIDACDITYVYCGVPSIFNRKEEDSFEEGTASSFGSSTSEIRDMFILDEERILTEEEENRVPILGDWYVVPDWSIKTAKRVRDSRRFRKCVSNILLYGPSGTGKTEGSQAIAAMLGLPYYSISCSADDDKFDLLGSLVPNTSKTSSSDKKPDEICKELGIPTFEDVEFDFEGSFEKLFNKKPTKLDSAYTCYQEISRRLLENSTADDNNDFVFVESELIEAIKKGGFCEIQEANVIKQASVMEVLNPLLANGGENSFIKLQTGEIIHRHPDCILCFTVNRDYEGCNNLQEAVYSRINYIKQVPEPNVEELFTRTSAQTGFNNIGLLKKMATCVYDIHEYCKEKDITSGVCGPRELIDWAQNAILESEDRGEERISEASVIIAAFETILEKVAQNDDDIEDVTVGVFKKHFSPGKVDELKKA